MDSDADLIGLLQRAAAGEQAAFRSLYDRAAPKLLAIARRILNSNAAAEDAVQEAFVRIWHRAGTYDPAIAAPNAWMTTIVRHAAIDALRRGPEKVSRLADDVSEIEERLAAPGEDRDPLQSRALAGCLEGLPEDRRAMVMLAYCCGWSREDLAARFDRPAATVKTVLRRALISLKECLGE